MTNGITNDEATAIGNFIDAVSKLNIACVSGRSEQLILKENKKGMAKIQTYQSTMVYDIANHMREKGMPDTMAGYLRFLLEDNILMNIKVDGKLYEVAWRYWNAYVMAHGSCCGTCNDDTLAEVERTKNELLKNATELTDYAIDY
jgi:hypothetical protein